MNIIYIGDATSRSTSRHRADALSRLGHSLVVEDPYAGLLPQVNGKLHSALHYRSGYRFVQKWARVWICELIHRYSSWPSLIWVNGGELFGRRAVHLLRQFGCPVLLYNNDDPTGGRDKGRFYSLISAIPAYDFCVVVRKVNVKEFIARGAVSVFRVRMSYDELMHKPYADASQIAVKYQSDVAFVGTWIAGEGRDKLLLALIKSGLNVAIWGDRWRRAPGWNSLKAHWRGASLSGPEYVAAIQGAKIALGLLSHGNRDFHTTRSVEIPYAGGLLCAERTAEHTEMYLEGIEAVFWADASECIEVCKRLLANHSLRERIRERGMRRALSSGYGNEAVCSSVITAFGARFNRLPAGLDA